MISKFVFISSVICLTVSLWKYLGNNCCNNPVLKQNISEIIQSWPGFTAEEYYVITEDGYKLLVERSYSKITQETPIIVVHGMAMNAFGWVNRGNVSLARLLGDLGYDVWMLNFRGSWYSKGHVELNHTERDYWKFNLNDLGIYDLRSSVKLVNEKTNRKSIYLGYSMATTCFFIYSSAFPEEANEYIKGSVLMAPVINYKDSRSFLRFSKYWWPYLEWFVKFIWNGEILPGYSVVLRPLVTSSPGIYGIQFFMNMLCGDDYEQIDHNAKQIYSEVPPSSRCGYHVVSFEKWNHLDFLIAKDLPNYLYKYLFNKIKEIDSGKCAP